MNYSNDDIKNDLGINNYAKFGDVVDSNSNLEKFGYGIKHGIQTVVSESMKLLNDIFHID